MYSTLFRKAYPWSYDYEELAGYYGAFSDLTDRFMEAFPSTVRRVNYEQLVTEPEEEVRLLLSFLDLPWEPACMDFYKKPTPTATASMQQVRKPVYREAIDRWRNYPEGIHDLTRALESAGITTT
jgi:hypothetical protein